MTAHTSLEMKKGDMLLKVTDNIMSLKSQSLCTKASTAAVPSSSSSSSSSSLPPPPPPPTTTMEKKRVTFASTFKVTPILHVNDYTRQEIQACWFQPFEYEKIKYDIKVTLSKLSFDGGMYVPTRKIMGNEAHYDCERGLESRTREGSARKHSFRFQGRQAVLSEQAIQKSMQMNDPERIATLYRYCTKICQEEAQLLALKDEQAVRHRRSPLLPLVVVGSSSKSTKPRAVSRRMICTAA